MTFCEAWSLVKSTPTQTVVQPLRCRSWGCDECGPRRKKQLIATAFAGLPDSFLTLTCNSKAFDTPDQGARELANTWRLIRKRAMRHYKYKSLPFLAVFEKTVNGWPHLHIVLRCPWLGQKWIAQQMDELMKSPVCWIERIANDGRIAYYISKYCGKDAHRFGTCKRYWTSQDYQLPPSDEEENPDDEFSCTAIVERNWYAHVEALRERGYYVQWRRDCAILTTYFRPNATGPPAVIVRPYRNSEGWHYAN